MLTNVTAVVITFVTSLSSAQESTASNAVMTAVQLLWINIIMDTFAALALATDPATDKLHIGEQTGQEDHPVIFSGHVQADSLPVDLLWGIK